MPLRVGSLNVNGLYYKYHEVQSLMRQQDLDILFMKEPKLSEHMVPQIRGQRESVMSDIVEV